MKTLIAYFSRGGNTARAAKKIQEIAGGDLFEIKGSKNYGNYFQALGIARKEFSDNELPEVISQVEEFDTYDRVLIGFPVWYSKCPQLVVSFLKSHDFHGKDVYPFCTSGMSGPEGAVEQLKDGCEGAVMHPAVRFGKVEKEAVENWLNG